MQQNSWRRQKPPPVRHKTENEKDMDALDNVMIGMTAEKTVTVTSDMTVGHFVAQMERRCALDRTLPPEAGRWPSCFRDAYLAAMPRVSPRNVSFYGALTLLQKTYTVCRRQPAEGPQQAVRLAACARAALEDVRRQ